MASDKNSNIEAQIIRNIRWIEGLKIDGSTKNIHIITHRQAAPSGQVYVQAFAAFDPEWLLEPYTEGGPGWSSSGHRRVSADPKIYSSSRWSLETESALLDLLMKTEEEVGKFVKENKFTLTLEEIESALKFDDLRDGNTALKKNIENYEPPYFQSLISTQSHVSVIREGDNPGHTVTLRIPAPEFVADLEKEFSELARKAAREVFENEVAQVAKLAAQKQVNDMFGALASMGSIKAGENQADSVRMVNRDS